MSQSFQLDIITPTSIKTINNVEYLRIPSIDGLIGIQSKHATAIIALDIGEIQILNNHGEKTYYATSGGFADIKPEGTQLLLETIEQNNKIDKKRAQQSANRANKRMHDTKKNLKRVGLSLQRAKNRLLIISRFS